MDLSLALTYQVVKLEISMHDCVAIPRKIIPDVIHNFIVVLMRTP